MTYLTPKGERKKFNSETQLIREDGRVEKLCKHGVGHPVGHLKAWKEWMGVHGCCGCCFGWEDEVVER